MLVLWWLTQSGDPVQLLRSVSGYVVSSEPANLSTQAESNAVSVNIVTKHRPNDKDKESKDLKKSGNFWPYDLKHCENWWVMDKLCLAWNAVCNGDHNSPIYY